MTAPKAIKRYRRFKGWDYTKGASLFITIATEPRRPLFGEIKGGRVVLTPLGEKVAEALQAMPRLNPGLRLFGWVVMPDHIHFNCALVAGLEEPLKVLGWAIRRFKNYTTKLVKLAEHSSAIKSEPGSQARFDGQTAFGQLWQQGYHDYILLSRSMIDSTERYIAYNPMKWELMYGEGGGLRVVEPLSSPRLDLGDYWKGVGNIALLSPDEKLASLRVSREGATPAAIAAVVRRMESAVEKGYVIISGFISKGERAVRDMPVSRKDAKSVHSHSALLHTEPPLQAGECLHRAFCGESLPRDRARQRRDRVWPPRLPRPQRRDNRDRDLGRGPCALLESSWPAGAGKKRRLRSASCFQI